VHYQNPINLIQGATKMIKFFKNVYLKTKAKVASIYHGVKNYFSTRSFFPAVSERVRTVTGVVIPASFAAFATSANAEVPASVTTAITTAVADVGVIGAAVLAVVIAIFAFKWLRRAI
jgi:hypothetical protein